MSYYNFVAVSQLRNYNLHNSDHSIAKMCEEYQQQQEARKEGEMKENWERKKMWYLMQRRLF